MKPSSSLISSYLAVFFTLLSVSPAVAVQKDVVAELGHRILAISSADFLKKNLSDNDELLKGLFENEITAIAHSSCQKLHYVKAKGYTYKKTKKKELWSLDETGKLVPTLQACVSSLRQEAVNECGVIGNVCFPCMAGIASSALVCSQYKSLYCFTIPCCLLGGTSACVVATVTAPCPCDLVPHIVFTKLVCEDAHSEDANTNDTGINATALESLLPVTTVESIEDRI